MSTTQYVCCEKGHTVVSSREQHWEPNQVGCHGPVEPGILREELARLLHFIHKHKPQVTALSKDRAKSGASPSVRG